jgi:hypothetical protein
MPKLGQLPMIKRYLLALAITVPGICIYSQVSTSDSSTHSGKATPVIDTTFDYDMLFQDFDAFMDSILTPHSYFLASLSMSKGYYNFESKNNFTIEASKRLTYSPTLAYYHVSGLGLTTTGYIVNDKVNANFYQLAVSPSFDYLKNKKLATGISVTRYFTKDSLPFYNTPLQNEVYAYFTWRKAWIRPTVAASYGWGSRTEYEKREELIQDIRLRRLGYTFINSKESISDFSLMTSVRHDFYWLDVFTYNDHIRLTPLITFTSGTQKFGFNQSSSTYATVIRSGANVIYNTQEIILDDQIKFQPLSLTFSLRGEYSIGRFFIQPQFALDHYFPGNSKKITGIFSVNAGLLF